MGNNQQQSALPHRQIELDRPEAIYLPNDLVSGNVLYTKKIPSFIVLTGIVRFKKHKKKEIEHCEIIFFSSKSPLISSSNTKQAFQFRLNEYLPPSFNNARTFPHVSYSINLVSQKSKDQIYATIPIRVCPRIQIDQPLLLSPLIFGPVENHNYATKLNIKVNRSAFKFGNVIEMYCELQNPSEAYIQKIDVTLGIYSLVESNIYQADVASSIGKFNNILSKQKLIRHKILLNVPENIYLPPTLKYKYDQGGDRFFFHLTIDYNIQFKIYLGSPENLWQVDVPVILCNDLAEQTETETCDVASDCEMNVVTDE